MRPRMALTIATWFGSGLWPPIPPIKEMGGAWGSLAAIPLCVLALWIASLIDGSYLPMFSYVAVLALVFLAGCWAVPTAEAVLGPMTDRKGKTRWHDQN